MTIAQLKKQLIKKSPEALLEEIVILYKTFPAVKDYYQLSLAAEGSSVVLDKYKAKVQHEFFPKRGHGKLRLAAARKAISDFKKVSNSPSDVADIMLFYVRKKNAGSEDLEPY